MNSRGIAGDARRRPRRRHVSLAALLAVGLALAPTYADASPGHSHHVSPAGTVALLLLAAMIGIVAATARRWGRQAAMPALALLIGWFALESAIHSVHHFWDPQSAASCQLSLASQHVEGAGISPQVTGTTTWTPQSPRGIGDQRIRPRQAFRAHEGRAPPALLSA